MNTLTPPPTDFGPADYDPAGPWAEALADLLGDRFSRSGAVRDHHGRGEGLRDAAPPDAVAWPLSTEEVAEIVKICARHRTPIVVFGAGTSLEGQVAAVRGGLCLDMSRMDKVLSVSAEDLDCRVQAGVTRLALNAEIRSLGLMFPLDPGADATLGGMASTRASGTNAVRYGTMREVTLGLTVVTPAGEVIRTGGRARKSSAGYDLTRLYIGAEGTLGVITEVQLRLFGAPEAIAAASCQFDDLESAVRAVMCALQIGLPLARIELLDELQMRACIRYSRLEGFEEKPTLFFEFHGGPKAVEEQIAQLKAVTDDLGAGAYRWAERPEDRTALWKARHESYYAGMALAPGKQAFATDACVPISALADCILETKAAAKDSGLICPIVGHVGDGNFHVLVLFDPDDAAERAAADVFCEAMWRRALKYGGTCTGEHGVGLHKIEALRAEHAEAVDVMRAVKQALDPLGIMNPGKIFAD